MVKTDEGMFSEVEMMDDTVPDFPAMLPDDEVDTDVPPLADTADIPEPEPNSVALVCQVDGCENRLSYKGSGRKPKYCAEHKRPASKTRVRRGDDADAALAAETLTRLNDLIAIAFMIAPGPMAMPNTGKAISNSAEKFQEQAEQALKSSPELARSIARAGGMTGAAGLVVAYGMLASSVAPIAVAEWKERNAT